MQTQVASLLLIVSSVAFASIVVGFATVIMQQTLDVENNPQIGIIQELQDQMSNQTSTWYGQVQNQLTNQTITDTGP
jgi:hypothetical protein